MTARLVGVANDRGASDGFGDDRRANVKLGRGTALVTVLFLVYLAMCAKTEARVRSWVESLLTVFFSSLIGNAREVMTAPCSFMFVIGTGEGPYIWDSALVRN